MDDVSVSVIIPAYNAGRYLAEAIDSALEQTCAPAEVIVVDDGSTDDTAAVARRYSEVRYIYQPNQGPAVARNTGAAAAKGNFLAFLDADDIWLPEKLQLQLEYLRDHPEIGYALAALRHFLEAGVDVPDWARFRDFAEDQIVWGTTTLLTPRAIFEKVGGFDPSYSHGEDTDWFFRAKDMGIKGFVLPQALTLRRVHDSNLSAKYAQDHKTHSLTLRLLRASIARQKAQEEQRKAPEEQ